MKQPLEKSAQCLKSVHRIRRTDTYLLLAIESEMCYNIPAKATVATVSPEKPGSTTCRAVTTTPAPADSSMQIPLQARDRASWVTICLRIVVIIPLLRTTLMVDVGNFLVFFGILTVSQLHAEQAKII